MPDPGVLPPSVLQGLGWSPAADPTQAPPVPTPPDGPMDFGGLPPSVVQGMGWAPPPASAPPPPDLPPTPTQLPSQQGQLPAPQPTGTPDYQVPVSAFGKGTAQSLAPKPAQPTAVPAPAAAHPQTFGQRMNALDQREADTTAQQQQAIQAGVEAEKQKNAASLAAYQQYDQQAQANAADRNAENEQWAKIYATNEAQTNADRQAIESWKFNRNAYMDSLGVGGEVGWGIGAILAGVGNALMGNKGANPVIEQLQANIHDANEQQFKQRDALVQKLGMDRQTGLDAQAYHATRQAEIDKQDGLALTALSKQIEEAAVKSADPMAQARGMQAAAEARAKSDELLKGSIQMRSQHDMQAQQNAIAGGHLALAQKQFDWTKEKDQQELDLKAAAIAAKGAGKLSEEESKRALFIPGPDGSLQVARNQKGEPVLSTEAPKDRKMIAAAESYNRLVGQMVRGIKDHGGESDYFKSADWQHMQTDLQSAITELHDAYGITSFRGKTAELFEKMATGGVDPTSFIYNAIPALQQSNSNLQGRVNAMLKSNGYDGPPIQWQDTSSPAAPTQTEEQKITSDALLNPRRGFDKRPGKLGMEIGNYSERGPLGKDETIDTRLQQAGGILPSVRQAMDTWGAALQSPDLAIRNHYYQQLQKIAAESESPETAAYAQQILDRAMSQQVSATPGAANAPEVTRGSAGATR